MSNLDFDDFAVLAQARQLWSDGHADQAFGAFEQAIETRPHNIRAKLEFAEVMGRCYQIEFAEELLGQGEALAADEPHALTRVASAYNRISRPRKAIDILESLRGSGTISPQGLGELSLLYEYCNRLDKAHAAILECIEQAPQQPEPKLILAGILRQRGESEHAGQILNALVADHDLTPLILNRVWTEICLLRDHEGDFPGSIQAIEKARELQRQLPEVGTLQRRNRAIRDALRSVYEHIDVGAIQRWSSNNLPVDPECGGVAHLIGFPRSGTTLLERILDAHPMIVSSPERAIFTDQIFPVMCQHRGVNVLSFPALNEMSRDSLAELRQLYLHCHQSVLDQTLGGRCLLDKNPNHTSLVAGLFRLFPESQFVFALRDPRDVIVSNYLRYFPLNEFSSSFLTWEGTVEQYVSDMNTWLRMRELLNDNWIEVRYEDTVFDMELQARRVLKSCGLEWDDSVREYRDRQRGHFVNSPSRGDVVKPIYPSSIGRWKNYRECLEPLLDRLSPILDAIGYS